MMYDRQIVQQNKWWRWDEVTMIWEEKADTTMFVAGAGSVSQLKATIGAAGVAV